MVNFWATWCPPCRAEFPLLAEKLRANEADGLALVGVLYRDPDTAAARAFVADMGARWPTVTDPDGAIETAYRVAAPPQTYFIDREGVIRSIQVGELTGPDFDRQYAKIR